MSELEKVYWLEPTENDLYELCWSFGGPDLGRVSTGLLFLNVEDAMPAVGFLSRKTIMIDIGARL